MLEERGLDELVRALSSAIGGPVIVLDAQGETLAEEPSAVPPEAAVRAVRDECARERPPVPPPARTAKGPSSRPTTRRSWGARSCSPSPPAVTACRRRGWLAGRDTGGLGDFERLILQQAVTVVALELMRQRAMRDTERRLAGDVLAEAVGGPSGAPEREVASRVRPFGVGSSAAVLVFACPDPTRMEPELDRFMADTGTGALVATRDDLLCAVVDASSRISTRSTWRLAPARRWPRPIADRRVRR